MNKAVGIGACVMDTLINVPNYPKEDTKMRAESSKQAGGGPVATGLVAAAKLGAEAEYIGVLSDDAGGGFLIKDFKKYGVKTDNTEVLSGYRSFTSVIWLSAKASSRTCVFDKGNLPPLKLNDEQKKAIIGADLLMIDGNEMSGALEAVKTAQRCFTTRAGYMIMWKACCRMPIYLFRPRNSLSVLRVKKRRKTPLKSYMRNIIPMLLL